MPRDVAEYQALPTLEEITVPGLWILGGKDKSIPVPLTIETLDVLKGQGKDFTCIYYPNANHVLVDKDTHALYPFLLDTLNWLEDKL